MMVFSKGLQNSLCTFAPGLIRLPLLGAMAVTTNSMAKTTQGELTDRAVTMLQPIYAVNQDGVVSGVEVFKGHANGLLSNTGYRSGTINFIRKRHKREFSADANLFSGVFAKRRPEMDISLPLHNSESVRGCLIGAYQKDNSYLDRYGLESSILLYTSCY